MKCQKCLKDFEEKDIHESHDVPSYLWEGNRAGRKNQADKWGRHYLCKECHEIYENSLRQALRTSAYIIAKDYFKEVQKDGDGV